MKSHISNTKILYPDILQIFYNGVGHQVHITNTKSNNKRYFNTCNTQICEYLGISLPPKYNRGRQGRASILTSNFE